MLHVGTNDLTKGINTMKNIRKCVEVIRELDNSENIQIGFSSIMNRSDKGFSKEISELNVKLKTYYLGWEFIYVDNDNINESCLNNSKLHLNEKGTNLFSKNVSTSLDVIWNASTDAKKIDNTNHNMKKYHNIDQVLSDLRSTDPSNLNFCYLNINSVRNKFTDFQEIINGNVDVVSIK